MSDYGFPPYVSVAEKRAKAQKTINKLKKSNQDIEPVIIEGRKIANTWWGKSWNKNLESYADYSNRIARGRSYVCNRAVVDLKMKRGEILAKVQGSSRPYEVKINIDTLASEKWGKVIELCNNRVDSLEMLVEGKFPKELEVLFTEKKYGLFPSPKEIHFKCSCPDSAYMCKHIAAVLYGVGARLDHNPMLFFELRDIDSVQLLKRSMESKLENMLKNAGKKSSREINEQDVLDLFGL